MDQIFRMVKSEIEPVRIFWPDSTGKLQNLRRLTGRLNGFWPARSTGFFTEGFCSLFNASNEKFSKGGGLD